ncbi:MAG: HAD-IA family hydrolase [Chlorobi bacterium]|nr:HAD-IA family hydrolase [Chlorobiota bacterium]
MEIIVDPKAKGLIFDLDGTLSDSLPVHVYNWNTLGEKYGFKFDDNILHRMTGRPTIEFARVIIKENNLSVSAEELVKSKQELFWGSVGLVNPIKEVVAIVKKYYGILPMSVGTGASRRSAELQLATLKIDHCFVAVVSANDVSRHKPDPDTFLRCAELMGVEPSACQVFEDGVLGIAAAKNAGMMITDVREYIDYGSWVLSK